MTIDPSIDFIDQLSDFNEDMNRQVGLVNQAIKTCVEVEGRLKIFDQWVDSIDFQRQQIAEKLLNRALPAPPQPIEYEALPEDQEYEFPRLVETARGIAHQYMERARRGNAA